MVSDCIKFLQEIIDEYGDLPAVISLEDNDGHKDLGLLEQIVVYEPDDSKGELWCMFTNSEYEDGSTVHDGIMN